MIQLRFCFAAGVLTAFAAMAQAPPPPAGHPGFDTAFQVHAVGGGDFTYIRAGSFDSKLVKGAPYSAQAVTEFTQTLADGNHIRHSNTASIARDSEGRTRREESINAIGPLASSGESPKSIFIHDPVAKTSYMLEPASRTAHAMGSRQAMKWIAEDKAIGGEVGTMVAHVEPDDGPIMIKHVERSSVHDEDSGKTEDLGTQVMEGLAVQGKRVTHTIPAGKFGNEREIQTVIETWYSADLQTMVMTKTSDPRHGETVYKLTSITRAEPDPALFRVPSDYTVTEGPPHMRTIHAAPKE